MDSLFRLAERFASTSLRLSLGVVLAWIGALKFVDPTPVVGLLQASFAFLAFPQFVYLLGAESKAEPRPVQVGDWAGDEWIINAGLKAGDKVIVDGVARIFAPGSPVRVAEPKKESEKK